LKPKLRYIFLKETWNNYRD